MSDETIQFKDTIPYGKISGEMKLRERKRVRRVLEELGAKRVVAIHQEETYLVTGIVENNFGSLPKIYEVLKRRGGKAFSQKIQI